MSIDEVLAVTCPRCGGETPGRFYGPCATCRDTLRATQGGQARAVEAADYEPKMNVTPNAVASKD
jgi:ribosomal protein S27E